VDIGSATSAHHVSLDGLAFEGASGRNRPNLKVLSSCIGHIPQPAPPLSMMTMDVHQQQMTKPCEVYSSDGMVDSLTNNPAMQRSVDTRTRQECYFCHRFTRPMQTSNSNIIKALYASNSSSPLLPILSYHLAHSCPPTYGYSRTDTSRVFQTPTRPLFFSGKLPHASSRSCASIIEDFLSSPSSFQIIQVSWVSVPTPLLSYGIVRQSHVSMTDVTSQE